MTIHPLLLRDEITVEQAACLLAGLNPYLHYETLRKLEDERKAKTDPRPKAPHTIKVPAEWPEEPIEGDTDCTPFVPAIKEPPPYPHHGGPSLAEFIRQSNEEYEAKLRELKAKAEEPVAPRAVPDKLRKQFDDYLTIRGAIYATPSVRRTLLAVPVQDGATRFVHLVRVSKIRAWAATKGLCLWGPPEWYEKSDPEPAKRVDVPSQPIAEATPAPETPQVAVDLLPKQDKAATSARNDNWRTRGQELLNEDNSRTIRSIAKQIAQEHQSATGKTIDPATIEKEALRGLKKST